MCSAHVPVSLPVSPTQSRLAHEREITGGEIERIRRVGETLSQVRKFYDESKFPNNGTAE